MHPAIFIDFDGTIVPYDVEFEIYKRFGANHVVELWEQGRLDAVERFTLGFNALRAAEVKTVDLHAFLDDVPIDETFPAFLSFLQKQNWPHAILSDGLGWYIKYVFQKHSLALPPVIANEINLENKWHLSFPHHNTDCALCRRCGTCKRYPLRHAKGWADLVVLITDSNADRWAALECDVVFAKEPLLTTLRAWEKPRMVFGFKDFDEVQKILKQFTH